jgi:mannose-1-phosphate guanylyltransferase
MAARRKTAPSNHFAVLMAGGVGSRFWPWSRADLPKQLLNLTGDTSMLAETAARARSVVAPENILVVTSARLRRRVRDAVPWLSAGAVLCEPVGRNTAACVGWAALEARARDADATLLVLPADHVVAPLSRFAQAARAGLDIAEREDRLVTFGVRPTVAATGYGYIRTAQPRSVAARPAAALPVAAFHEKPSEAKAKRYLASGSFYWNSGMFAWRADTVLAEIAAHLPKLARGLDRLEAHRKRGRIAQKHVDALYGRLPEISIDHGVLEKSRRVVMIPATFRWSDIGDWNAVAELWPADAAGNRSRDPLVAVDAHDNVVATHGKPVGLLGVDGLAVVDAGDALLVCPRERAQEVRAIVAALGPAGLAKLS